MTDQVLDMYVSGNHGFLIRDGDEGGVGDEQTLNSRDKLNDGPPELVLVFDDSTPETTIDSGPPALSDSAEARFTFSSDRDDATFECSLDGACVRAVQLRRSRSAGSRKAPTASRSGRRPRPGRRPDAGAVRLDGRQDRRRRRSRPGRRVPSAGSAATFTFTADAAGHLRVLAGRRGLRGLHLPRRVRRPGRRRAHVPRAGVRPAGTEPTPGCTPGRSTRSRPRPRSPPARPTDRARGDASGSAPTSRRIRMPARRGHLGACSPAGLPDSPTARTSFRGARDRPRRQRRRRPRDTRGRSTRPHRRRRSRPARRR